MKGGAVVSVWHMVIIAGANTHDHDGFSMKDSLLVFQAFICCECLLGRNLLYEYYVSPTLAVLRVLKHLVQHETLLYS